MLATLYASLLGNLMANSTLTAAAGLGVTIIRGEFVPALAVRPSARKHHWRLSSIDVYWTFSMWDHWQGIGKIFWPPLSNAHSPPFACRARSPIWIRIMRPAKFSEGVSARTVSIADLVMSSLLDAILAISLRISRP